METKVIEYILSIAKNKSISKAADELFMTQSALNQQLMKLEKELGTHLFIRTRSHWELTDAGKLYVENSKKILQIKKQTYDEIQDLSQKWNGKITIGITPERGIQMFTAIFPQIHKKYPNTTFQPIEADVESQIKMLDSNELDISFQTISGRKYKHFSYRKILDEPFYICIPKSHPAAYKDQKKPSEYPVISLTEFKEDLFTLVKKTSTMRVLIDSLFDDAGFKPKLLFESTSMRTMQKLTENGQCCSIIPRCYAIPSMNIAYFIPDTKSSWELVAVHAKNHYINKAARDFITMASDYWRSHLYIE
jgi:DNA-binding transcriptional LysR family regulator